eukprot:8633300-Alexandrium_andersonii.AAC.1
MLGHVGKAPNRTALKQGCVRRPPPNAQHRFKAQQHALRPCQAQFQVCSCMFVRFCGVHSNAVKRLKAL